MLLVNFQKKGKGSFIFTASMSASIVNVPQLQAAYNAAKAGVKHLSKSLSVEWAPFARVNSVSPGYIATHLSEFADPDVKSKWLQLTPLGRSQTKRACWCLLVFGFRCCILYNWC